MTPFDFSDGASGYSLSSPDRSRNREYRVGRIPCTTGTHNGLHRSNGDGGRSEVVWTPAAGRRIQGHIARGLHLACQKTTRAPNGALGLSYANCRRLNSLVASTLEVQGLNARNGEGLVGVRKRDCCYTSDSRCRNITIQGVV